MSEPLEATLRRLEEERAEADRKYNDALTALDRAVQRAPDLPDPPAAYDERQITPLNESFNIIPDPPQAAGVLGRLAGFVWSTIAPYLQRQLTFNSLVVDHVNRNVVGHRETRRVLDALIATLRQHHAHQAEAEARLMLLLQQVTAYVDTKDRATAGGALVLNASLSALAESMAKRWESMAASMDARARRYEARTAQLSAEHADLRTAVGVAHQAALTVKRELERRAMQDESPRGAAGSSRAVETVPTATARSSAFASELNAYKYVAFEDRFRGSREDITARLQSYLPFFDGAGDVLDVGCGRGEFLDLLRERGVRARGIDLNPEMVQVCIARGLDVTHADAVGYLSTVGDGTVGGIFAAQVVEHLQPAYLLQFLELAFHKLAPGAQLVLETLNPACWVAFFESYIRDITHVWPLHPETLKYLVIASGFTTVRVEFRSPVPEQDRLQPVVPTALPGELQDFGDAYNANVEKLNARIFTYLDYAIVASRP